MALVTQEERVTVTDSPERAGETALPTLPTSSPPLPSTEAARAAPRRRTLRPLSRPVRVALLVGGWIVTLTGVAGLFLPVLQGVLFLLLGLAMLSVGSQRFHGWLRAAFRRWPRGWRRMEKLRRRLHFRLQRRD
jgi:hypothetical protein